MELYLECFGDSRNVPVVLIPGAMAPRTFWNDWFCLQLAEAGFYVIRFDNRDMGKSTHFESSSPESGRIVPYSIFDMAEDALAVLLSASDKPAHIIGHSLGGSIAQIFSTKYPHKVQTLSLISSPLLSKGSIKYKQVDPNIAKEIWDFFGQNPLEPNFDRGLSNYLQTWKFLNGDWELDIGMATEYTRAIYETEVIEPAWNHMNVQESIPDIYREFSKLEMKKLFLQGERDFLPTHPDNQVLCAEHSRNATSEMLKGAGHMFFNKALWEIIASKIIKHIT